MSLLFTRKPNRVYDDMKLLSIGKRTQEFIIWYWSKVHIAKHIDEITEEDLVVISHLLKIYPHILALTILRFRREYLRIASERVDYLPKFFWCCLFICRNCKYPQVDRHGSICLYPFRFSRFFCFQILSFNRWSEEFCRAIKAVVGSERPLY